MTLFRLPVLTLFTRDEAVLAVAARYVVVVLPFTWCYAVFNGIINYVNGLGEIRYPTVVNLLILWAVRIPPPGCWPLSGLAITAWRACR